jgi:hypothetical protein
MYVRQCVQCATIDGRKTFDDWGRAVESQRWVCEHCGSSAFEAVVMAEDEPTGDIADEFE